MVLLRSAGQSQILHEYTEAGLLKPSQNTGGSSSTATKAAGRGWIQEAGQEAQPRTTAECLPAYITLRKT